MADDKNVTFKVTGQFTTDGEGKVVGAIQGIGNEAKKTASPVDALSAKIDRAFAAGGVRANGIAKLTVELNELKKTGKLTEEELEKLALAEAKLGQATQKVIQTRVAMADLKEEIGAGVKNQTLANDLFDKSAGTLGQLKGAALGVGGAFAGGFATGVAIAKKAGVDFTEALALLDKTTKTVAEGLDKGINAAMGWLAEKAGIAADALGMKGLGRTVLDTADALRTQSKVNQERAKNEEAANRATAHAVALAKEQIALYGESELRIRELTAAELERARFEKKSADEIRAIEVEGIVALREFRKEQREAAEEQKRKAYEEMMAVANLLKAKQHSFAKALEIHQKTIALQEKEAKEALESFRKIAEGQRILEERGIAQAEKLLNRKASHEQSVGRMSIAKLKEFEAERLNLLKLRVQLGMASIEELEQAELESQDRILEATRASANASVQMGIGVANSLVDAANVLAGNNKEAALAKVLVDAAQASIAIWTGSESIYEKLAAEILVVAQGVKAYQDVESAPDVKGKKIAAPSFDDPVNDAAARAAGRASAIDVTNHFRTGFVSTLTAGNAFNSNGNTTTATPMTRMMGGASHAYTINVNVAPGTSTTEVGKQVYRMVEKAHRDVISRTRGGYGSNSRVTPKL